MEEIAKKKNRLGLLMENKKVMPINNSTA